MFSFGITTQNQTLAAPQTFASRVDACDAALAFILVNDLRGADIYRLDDDGEGGTICGRVTRASQRRAYRAR